MGRVAAGAATGAGWEASCRAAAPGCAFAAGRVMRKRRNATMARTMARKTPFVFHGPEAEVIGVAAVVISTAVGSPTPECSCSGIITENSPPSVEVCAFPRSASRILSRSPSSVFPIRPFVE